MHNSVLVTGGSNNTSLLFRSTTSICQPLRHFVPPRNATGHGRGRGLKVVFQFRYKDTLCTSPLCFVAQNIGEKQRSDSDEEGDWKDDMPRIV